MSDWRGENNPGHQRRRALWRDIEREFDEPLRDVIAGMREQGNSWRTVAGALGVHRSTLLQWRKALRLPLDQHANVKDASSVAERTPLDQKARALGYEDAIDAVIQMRLVDGMQLVEVARVLDCHINTVCNYTPRQLRGTIYVRSERWWRVRRQQAQRMAKLAVASRAVKGHLFHALNDEVFGNGNAGQAL